ncbi:cupin-like domain-containing protein [Maricaulis sp. D1M11]|uniref:cupin-like domain-containing protein n=1 Tax=Maricaulis sp. D1M11 TaxID=3076117 RepID=UPI0039B5C4D0
MPVWVMFEGRFEMETPLAPVRTAPPGPIDHLRAEMDAATPFIVRGLASHWPLVQASRTSSSAARQVLLDHHVERSFVVTEGPREAGGWITYNDDMSMNIRTERRRLGDILNTLADCEHEDHQPIVYMGSIDLETHFTGLADTHVIDGLTAPDMLRSIWIGTRTRVSAHNDFPDNMAVVAAGRRRFTLFPPDQFANLYLGPVDNTPAGRPVSLVDFHNPDPERFPNYTRALDAAQTAELEPGDAIFIPSQWWHQVEALDGFNILVNFWWRDTPRYLGQPQEALHLAMMSIRDLSAADRAHWREMFDHYVFNAGDDVTAHIPPGGEGVLGPMTADMARRVRAHLLRVLSQ